jgi:tRNA(Arg) A34 adenosine deaminase TadA
MDYLQKAVDLSKKSYDMGEFPAGAVLVTQRGNVYESDLSIALDHGECTAVDKAVAVEGRPLVGATLYTSMESCLMRRCIGRA